MLLFWVYELFYISKYKTMLSVNQSLNIYEHQQIYKNGFDSNM